MAVWLDDASKNIASKVDTGQDSEGHVREVSLYPGHAGTTQHAD